MKAAVVGRGRWGRRLAGILEDEGHAVRMLSLRKGEQEKDTDFAERCARRLRAEAPDAALVWLAVPPSAPQAALVRGALLAGKHVVVEKPWWGGLAETVDLASEANRRGLVAAVHFQYCYLDDWPALVGGFDAGDAEFRGTFTTARAARPDIPAGDNLATHLLAVRRRWFPRSRVGEFHYECGTDDCRRVELRRGERRARVDFTTNAQPIVQRFLADVLAHAEAGAPFPLDLAFAAEVQSELARIEGAE
jgi:predicted dehydrogenase